MYQLKSSAVGRDDGNRPGQLCARNERAGGLAPAGKDSRVRSSLTHHCPHDKRLSIQL